MARCVCIRGRVAPTTKVLSSRRVCALVSLWVAVSAAAGCGRVGFDPVSVADDADDSPLARLVRVPAGTTPQPLTDIPVPVRWSADPTTVDELADGSSLIFTSRDGDVLPHEIERLDSDGSVVAWVLVSSISPASDTEFLATFGPADSVIDRSHDVWADGYSAVWHFGGGESVVYDATGNGNDLQPIVGSAPAFVDGVVGSGVLLDGVDDFYRIATTPDLEVSAEFTVFAWANPAEFPANGGVVLSKSDMHGTSQFDYMARSYGGGIGCHTQDTTGDVFDSVDSPIATDTWFQFACTYDGAVLRAFQDGSSSGTSSEAGVARISARGLNVGSHGQVDPTRLWHGAIDEVRILSRAMSAAEIELAHAVEAPDSAVVVGDWSPTVLE